MQNYYLLSYVGRNVSLGFLNDYSNQPEEVFSGIVMDLLNSKTPQFKMMKDILKNDIVLYKMDVLLDKLTKSEIDNLIDYVFEQYLNNNEQYIRMNLDSSNSVDFFVKIICNSSEPLTRIIEELCARMFCKTVLLNTLHKGLDVNLDVF